MKLTSVEIHPENSSDVVVLSFRDPSRINPYNVKAIIGLDADEIVPRYYGSFGSSKFYNLTVEKRDIIVRVELNPSYSDLESYSDLRDNLYKMIASSRTGRLQLQFKNNAEIIAVVSGKISKLEAPHFEKTPEVQLTINCDEAMLTAPDPVEVVIAGLDPSLTTIIDNKSTAPHGFIFSMTLSANIASIIITDPNDSSWNFEIVPIGGFLIGDVLHYSSEHNDKYLYLVRGGNTIYLADVITPGSMWPIMFPGDNHFSFSHPNNLTWNDLSYFPRYWGV